MKDKVALEKGRLATRVGAAARMYQANLNPEGVGITALPQDAAGFLSDADRFHSDTSGEEYLRRQAAIQRKQQIDANAQRHLEREQTRWEAIEQAKAAEEEHWDKARADPLQGRKNNSAVPYNLVNLKYDGTADGEKLRHEDDLTKFRANLRAHNMTRHGDTRVGYNILTGEAKPPTPYMQRPPTPDQLMQYKRK